jgi:glycine/D-amino acid oxidase-like deaminating enzyme
VVFIGGGDVDFDGRIRPAMHHNTSRASMVVRDFRRYYPMLRTVKITHDWAGPIDRTINGLPIFGRLYEDANIYYGVGWSDSGVGPSVVGGKILASLALGRHDEWSGCGLITGSASSFPPEPIRFLERTS